MPDKSSILMLSSIGLHYILIICIYFFLYSVVKVIYKELSSSSVKTSILNTTQPKSNGSYLVVIESTTNLSQSKFLLAETASIGRNEDNDIIINEAFVSGEHANITYYKNYYWLTDLNSTNKTFLNQKVLEKETALKNGDIIQIGSVTFKFEG